MSRYRISEFVVDCDERLCYVMIVLGIVALGGAIFGFIYLLITDYLRYRIGGKDE
jgi:hypothetical protein